MSTRALLLGVAMLLAPRADASVVVAMTIGDLTRQADLVVIGKVSAARAFWSHDHRRILTRVFLEPEEAWKGTPQGAEIVVLLPGGELDGLAQEISGVPHVRVGERVVLFLRRRGESFRLVGMAQGLFRVPQATGGVGALAIRNLGGLKLVPVDPAGAGPPDALSLPLDALHARVGAAMGGGPVR